MVLAKFEQIAVTGDDGIGFGGERTGDDVIVVGVACDDTRYGDRPDELGDGGILGHQVLGGQVDPTQEFAELATAEYVGKFSEQHRAGDERDALLAAGVDESAWRGPPQQTGHHGVGVSDDPHREPHDARPVPRRSRPALRPGSLAAG